MGFRVLGSLEARRGDDVVQIGSRNERKVLTALLVDANSVVSRPTSPGSASGSGGRRRAFLS